MLNFCVLFFQNQENFFLLKIGKGGCELNIILERNCILVAIDLGLGSKVVMVNLLEILIVQINLVEAIFVVRAFNFNDLSGLGEGRVLSNDYELIG